MATKKIFLPPDPKGPYFKQASDGSRVLGSPTGKYPAPLTDNPPSPGRLEANRIVNLKRLDKPKK